MAKNRTQRKSRAVKKPVRATRAANSHATQHAVEQFVLPHHHAAKFVQHGLQAVACRGVVAGHGHEVVVHGCCSLLVHHLTDCSAFATSAEVMAKPMPTLPPLGP